MMFSILLFHYSFLFLRGLSVYWIKDEHHVEMCILGSRPSSSDLDHLFWYVVFATVEVIYHWRRQGRSLPIFFWRNNSVSN